MRLETGICTPEVAKSIGTARVRIENMCIDILRRCSAIVGCIQKSPTIWDEIVGNVILTIDERLEIADQVHDIRNRAEHALTVADQYFQEGIHPLEISLFVYQQIFHLSRWIDSILEGNSLPRTAILR